MEHFDNFSYELQYENVFDDNSSEELIAYREFQAYKNRKVSSRRRVLYQYADSYEIPSWYEEYELY